MLSFLLPFKRICRDKRDIFVTFADAAPSLGQSVSNLTVSSCGVVLGSAPCRLKVAIAFFRFRPNVRALSSFDLSLKNQSTGMTAFNMKRIVILLLASGSLCFAQATSHQSPNGAVQDARADHNTCPPAPFRIASFEVTQFVSGR